jgi:hypothetical protein
VGHICRVGTNIDAQLHADTFLEKTCELCYAFSQVANPAGNTVTWTHLEPAACAAAFVKSPAPIPLHAPAPRSRGPPCPAALTA